MLQAYHLLGGAFLLGGAALYINRFGASHDVLQGYHLLAAALFAPALLLAPPLLALALGVALAAMVVLEVVRLAQLPVIGAAAPLQRCFQNVSAPAHWQQCRACCDGGLKLCAQRSCQSYVQS